LGCVKKGCCEEGEESARRERGGKDWVMGAPVKEGVLRGGFGGKVGGAGVARRVRGVCAMVRDGCC
jgi:hypothetical protein